MAAVNYTLRIDGNDKQKADGISDNAVDVIATYRFIHMVRAKLEESETAASDPNTKRYTHEEIFAPLREKYGYTIQD